MGVIKRARLQKRQRKGTKYQLRKKQHSENSWVSRVPCKGSSASGLEQFLGSLIPYSHGDELIDDLEDDDNITTQSVTKPSGSKATKRLDG